MLNVMLTTVITDAFHGYLMYWTAMYRLREHIKQHDLKKHKEQHEMTNVKRNFSLFIIFTQEPFMCNINQKTVCMSNIKFDAVVTERSFHSRQGSEQYYMLLYSLGPKALITSLGKAQKLVQEPRNKIYTKTGIFNFSQIVMLFTCPFCRKQNLAYISSACKIVYVTLSKLLFPTGQNKNLENCT